MLASDLNNPQFVGAQNPDSLLSVTFYSKAVQNAYETEKQGRPIFYDADYVKIFTPGDNLNIIDTVANEDHKKRFPLQWAHYKNSKTDDQFMSGTPLSAWGLLTASQCEELRYLKFFSVESLADASDSQLQSIGMKGGMSPFSLRDKARFYLKNTKEAAEKTTLAEELSKRDETIEEMKKQLAELTAKADEAPRKGRPPKEEPIKE
jgi:hypothetical protein